MESIRINIVMCIIFANFKMIHCDRDCLVYGENTDHSDCHWLDTGRDTKKIVFLTDVDIRVF